MGRAGTEDEKKSVIENNLIDGACVGKNIDDGYGMPAIYLQRVDGKIVLRDNVVSDSRPHSKGVRGAIGWPDQRSDCRMRLESGDPPVAASRGWLTPS